MPIFEIGRVYHRQNEIHARFKGQPRGGISTPTEHPLIFLITGQSGSQYGYDDYLDDEGVFHYYGEGQIGEAPAPSSSPRSRG